MNLFQARLALAGLSVISTTMALQVSADVKGDGRHSHVVEEIVVTGAFQKSAAETALPVTVLAGEQLQEQVSNNLGETLQGEIGMANASFGTGVGQPVIRGQTGNRVKVLQNGAGVTDASSVSPDHANGVETVLAKRLEIIRGPSTLLYGSGAIGGVVNVIDGRIPDSLSDRPAFDIQQTWDTVNDESKTVGKLDLSLGNLAMHLEGFSRDNDQVDIKGFAVDEGALETLEELNHGMHEEEHEEEEIENTRGYIGNSNAESDGHAVGFSYVGERGFIGAAYSSLDNEYGLPPGVHGHHEEEHEEEHEEDHEEGHEDEADEHAHEDEEEVENVRIAMEKQRIDFRGRYDIDNAYFGSVNFSVGKTDYEHRELEIEADGGAVVGTLFENDGLEGRATLDLELPGAWSGVLGTQLSSTEFSATGEEAFIPVSDIDSRGLFLVTQYIGDGFSTEFGLRTDQGEIDLEGACDFDERSFSASASVLYDLNPSSNLLVGFSRSERTPSVEELYSNISTATCARPADDEDLVFHAATNLLEIGNPALSNEVSNNVELGWRKHNGRVRGEINLYYNEIDDYIYLDVTGEEHEEQAIAIYGSRDARFTGFEARIDIGLWQDRQTEVEFSLFADSVWAKFSSGGDIPRITPAKIGTSLALLGNRWSAHLNVTRVHRQDRTGPRELETAGYTRLSFYGDYHWSLGNDSEFKIFLQGNNLLDEEIRNHVSLLKNYSPDAGRNIRLGVRFTY